MVKEGSASLDFIKCLPKTETHLHIEGALPWNLLEKKDPQRFARHPAFRQEDYRYRSFAEFESILIDHALAFFDSSESYHEAAKAIFEIQCKQNVKYVEISFHAGMIEWLKIPGDEILSAIHAAIPNDLEVRVFLGMSRNAYNSHLAPILEEAVRAWDNLAGIDLHGLESLPMETWTETLWSQAKENGLILKAHAGEFGPAANVRHAIEKLQVRRIQHGVRASEDPAVMQLANDLGVVFDLCPISNFKLRVVDSWDQHPLPLFMERGIACTLSTDDPLSFNNSLLQEYRVCHEEIGLSRLQLAQLAANGFEAADLDPSLRDRWIREIRTLVEEADP